MVERSHPSTTRRRRSRPSQPRSTCSNASTSRSRRRCSSICAAAAPCSYSTTASTSAATVAPLVDRLLSWCPDVSDPDDEPRGTRTSRASRSGEVATARRSCRSAPTSRRSRNHRPVRLFVERAPLREARTSSSHPTTPLPSPRSSTAWMASHWRSSSRRRDVRRDEPRGTRRAAGSSIRSPRRYADIDGRARHRTLQDLVDVVASTLLDQDEQRLFTRLCVFAGSFGLDAVEGVCGVEDPGGIEDVDPSRESRRQVDGAARRRRASLATACWRHCASLAMIDLDQDERDAVRDRNTPLVSGGGRAWRRTRWLGTRGDRRRSRPSTADLDNLRV